MAYGGGLNRIPVPPPVARRVTAMPLAETRNQRGRIKGRSG
jgi:hypothetical protein